MSLPNINTRNFMIGMVAGGFALLVSFVLREASGVAFIPEMGAQVLFSVTPGTIESTAVENLQSYAKYSTFIGATIITMVLYGVVGLAGSRTGAVRYGTKSKQLVVFFMSSFSLFLVIGIVLLILGQVRTVPVSLPILVLSLLPPQIAFSAVFASFVRFPPKPVEMCQIATPPQGKQFDRRRRLFVKAGVATVVAAAILAYGVGFLLPRMESSYKPGSITSNLSSLMSLEITPVDQFYRVDVNIIPPSVNADTWNLSISGLVDNPFTFSFNDISNLVTVEQYNTLECVSNEIGGNLISTARWKGVRLKDLLNKAGLQPSAQYIVFKCVDGYDVGIPVDRALLDGTLLTFEMNGQPLPTEHGYPIRALVPGLYGMMNPKWITGIEAVNGVYEGYWQRRGWTNDARYETMSDVVVPGSAAVTERFNIQGSNLVPLGVVPIAGIAFAGDRGISKVEVSTDGGVSWMTASVKDPLSDYTWVLWSAEWNPPKTGNYKIMVRATDGVGNLQTATVTNPFPNGATGYHVLDISIVS